MLLASSPRLSIILVTIRGLRPTEHCTIYPFRQAPATQTVLTPAPLGINIASGQQEGNLPRVQYSVPRTTVCAVQSQDVQAQWYARVHRLYAGARIMASSLSWEEVKTKLTDIDNTALDQKCSGFLGEAPKACSTPLKMRI